MICVNIGPIRAASTNKALSLPSAHEEKRQVFSINICQLLKLDEIYPPFPKFAFRNE